MLRRIKTGAIVPDGELQPAVQASQANLRLARSGMACDVAQPLLRDAEEAERDVARQPLGSSRTFASSRVEHVCEKRSHSDFNASIKPRSSRIEGWSRYDRACTSSLNRTRPSRIARIGGSGRTRQTRSLAAGIDRQQRQALRHVVVQLARKARALLLLRVDQPSAQLVRCGFRAPALVPIRKAARRSTRPETQPLHRTRETPHDTAPMRWDRGSGFRCPEAGGLR